MTEIWIVTSEGVYDHGVYFAAETEAEAVAWANTWSPDTDGYHEWRVERINVGAPTLVPAADRWRRREIHPKHPRTIVYVEENRP